MGVKERQERERASTARAILDAARELFVAEGYPNVSIRKIAEKIEYSPAAIYSYFPSKDDIFLALAEEGSNREAEAAYGKALAASETLLGRDHREAAPTLAKLALVLRAQRDVGRAGAAEVRLLGIQEGVATDAIALSPADSDLYDGRGNLRARAGRFEEAIADYDKAIELDPRDHWRWYYRGCILAYTGHTDAYRAHCRAMLLRFGGATDRYVADRTAKTCMLLPGATPDLGAQLRLVQVVTAPGAVEESAEPWFRLLRGFAEYRRGDYAAAVDCLEQGRPAFTGTFVPAKATATFLLAMTHHRLGHAEQARSLFADARLYMDREMRAAGAEDLGRVNVEDWLICHVIRREADALFAGG